MTLNGALQIGRSALVTSQAGIQVAGHNMANAATVGFHRQTMHTSPVRGQPYGNIQVGAGVRLDQIRREVDSALQARYRDAISRQHRDLIDQRFLTAIESLQNELGNNDLSSALSLFFNSFSELANNPDDNAVRNVVINQGVSLAGRIAGMRSDYGVVLEEVDRSLEASLTQANDLLDRIAMLNGQITRSESPAAQANTLRDQRDLLVDELSQFIEVTAIEQSNGSVDLLVGSTPVLLGTVSRGIELRTTSEGSQTNVSLRVRADGTNLQADSGSIGGLLRQREETVRPAIDALDDFAGQLIFQVNRLHSQGQGHSAIQSISGTYGVDEVNANLNSAAAGLPFDIRNGSFFIHVTHSQTGVRTTHQINIDGNAMSLNDVINQVNTVVGVPNVQASIIVGNKLSLTANAGYEISFSDDSSGALAALGLNTFFTGSTAADIDVHQSLLSDPGMLAANAGHVSGSNGTAKAIADLQDAPISELNGSSLREFWQKSVNGLAVKTAAANAAVESSTLVKESINAQIQAVSGVSLDEESINLLTNQRQFQAAARFIGVIDEMMQTLLSIA